MAISIVLSGLIQKRAEIAGQIDQARETMVKLTKQLDHLDQTIRIFDPDVKPEYIPPKAVRRRSRIKDDVARVVLDCLREVGEPIGTGAVAEYILAKRGLSGTDHRLRRLAQSRAYAALRTYMKQGIVTPSVTDDGVHVWTVA